jgi:type IV pilus assembly protein PilE
MTKGMDCRAPIAMTANKAFTLIELLVVVVIIGILAAIALPKYQLASEKARAVQGITAAKTMGEAVRRYYLINGEYPTKFDALDISFNITDITSYGDGTTEKGKLHNDFDVYINYFRGAHSVLLDRMSDYNYRYTLVYCPQDGSMWCGAYVSALSNEKNERALCQALGGKLEDSLPNGCMTARIYNYRL